MNDTKLKLKTQFDKPSVADLFSMLKPTEMIMANGTHLICRFCGRSYFKDGIRYLITHIRRTHKAEFVSWFVNRKFQELYSVDKDITAVSKVARQLTSDTATYEINQVL